MVTTLPLTSTLEFAVAMPPPDELVLLVMMLAVMFVVPRLESPPPKLPDVLLVMVLVVIFLIDHFKLFPQVLMNSGQENTSSSTPDHATPSVHSLA
ncbi:hypothetical protein [Ktedonospora formicarum]|uniref:hypothetical protein n=1 Tax=Ktedonospora formicarum TaxID=2778364 RepID=UPI001C68F363|nr:hypothetical protein [Ktedonospora formicarum]